MNKKHLVVCGLFCALTFAGAAFVVSGCATATPTNEKYQDAEAQYKSGQLTGEEYEAAKQKIALDAIKKANAKEEADARAARNPRDEH